MAKKLSVAPALSGELWQIVQDGFEREQVTHYETLFTLANGYAGVRGSPEMTPGAGDPGFFVAGVYDQVGGFTHEIVNLPCWLGINANMDGFDFDLRRGTVIECRRVLDMRQGLLYTRILWRDDAKRQTLWESYRLMHKADRHAAVIWGSITAIDYDGNLSLSSRLDAWVSKHGSPSGRTRYGDLRCRDLDGNGIAVEAATCATRIAVAIASRLSIAGATRRGVDADDDRVSETVAVPLPKGKPVAFEKRVVFYTSRDGGEPGECAARHLAEFAKRPLAAVVREHVKAWAKVWETADVVIDGDAHAQHALRISLFHLASLANPDDEHASLGAKGLHGNGYAGLVFWDTETYLLPFFAFTDPATARALLMYRWHLLPDARANAAAIHMPGARYPWNSSVTARENFWRGWQEHVSPDIAYAVDQYVQATGDRQFLLDYGARLIIETAVYWPARVEFDVERGRYNLRGLGGPDEIHTNIDNNMYTNHLVAWHLRRAVQAFHELRDAGRWTDLEVELGITEETVDRWLDIADRMADTFSPAHGFHEQYEGYFKLKERAIDRTMTKMQYTGPVQHSFKPTRVLQQADTVLMYHLFRDDFPEAARRKGFEFYEPRCSHTSTLSRSAFAAVAAQSGRLDEALRLYHESLDTDIGPQAECGSGIHAACTGGNWQATVMGFAGFAIRDGVPSFRPRLPKGWKRLAFKLLWRGKCLEVEVRKRELSLRCRGGNLTVDVEGTPHRVSSKATVVRA